ncbi:MAG TPA: VWA domain-containing protein [Terracidiphilus sp.]
MKSLPLRLLFSACLLLLGVAKIRAQQLPPVEPPKPMPSQQQGSGATIQTTTTEVLVPTLVEKKGQVIYGLKQKDFVVEDNGIPQKIHVQEEMDTAPVALVVAVELGGSSVLEFGKLAKMGPLLDLFLVDPRSRAALVGFDSGQHLLCDFTHSGAEINDALNHLQPGDGGDAILDSVSYALSLLEDEPQGYRRVLLLISEERDHGSKHTKPEQVIRQIGRSDALVLSVSFSPAQAELAQSLKSDNEAGAAANLMTPLLMLIRGMRKNVVKEISDMSGGEYTTFTGDKRFEQRVVTAARDVRNRYLITFSPSNPTPGLHTLKVRTAVDYGAKIVARSDYWLGNSSY